MRRTWLVIGLLALAAAWLGPLPDLARQAFFGHMLMHMLVVAVAAPFLSLALAGTRYDPVEEAPGFFAPIPASVGELIFVWAWHAPGLHHLARTYTWGLFCEQATFLLAGIWIWLSAFGGSAPRDPGRSAAGVIGLLLTSMHMTLLGALLALAPRSVYGHHEGFGPMSALQDQHLGGAVMILVGGIAYLSGGLVLTVGLLREQWAGEAEPA
ncbi:Cytochrome c oxidase caa3 assembly factor (Caa3_CtaG) [Maioricimonas rarisocia]|uniref:Cytochrome c oxidase caa3 assembly factor (Caa3_CtaG) n=1 Tax=Maioricimonas rarisocia TaxID=2528026 RepID=A0A517ZEL7_9PLAN|nr:cytochrome c oxidase assembly protein [Maioricimonas rarisocia]QDU40869.1 Cytochrome c oxidase caa3 assembly factor (Caa3_CtaG) [Maioricimonas rarisocia]